MRPLFLALLLLASACSRAQVLVALILGDELNSGKIEFGLTTGLNASRIDGLEGGRAELTPYLGLYFDIKLSDRWYLHPETWPKCVLGHDKLPAYATGDSTLDLQLQEATVERRIDCIPTLLMISRRVGRGTYIDAGPYATLVLGARDVFIRETADDQLEYTVKITDQVRTIDLGVGAGVRYKLSKGTGINIGVHYFRGFSDIITNASGQLYWWRASVGVPIGRGKALKKTEVKEE